MLTIVVTKLAGDANQCSQLHLCTLLLLHVFFVLQKLKEHIPLPRPYSPLCLIKLNPGLNDTYLNQQIFLWIDIKLYSFIYTSHLNMNEFFHQDPCLIPRGIYEYVKTSYLAMVKKVRENPRICLFIWICTKKLMWSILDRDQSSTQASWKSVQQ